MKPIGFRIHYADRTSFSSRDGPWSDAPSHGVLVVVVFFDQTYRCWHGSKEEGAWQEHSYRNVLHGGLLPIDYYWFYDGEISGGTAEQVPNGAELKLGVWSPSFDDVLNEAMQEELWL